MPNPLRGREGQQVDVVAAIGTRPCGSPVTTSSLRQSPLVSIESNSNKQTPSSSLSASHRWFQSSLKHESSVTTVEFPDRFCIFEFCSVRPRHRSKIAGSSHSN
ncbi:hypothetical protein L1887_15257 [Cichorium endivia]|nr:hypothetical protein L1887_15257 [Cichorium endivia]